MSSNALCDILSNYVSVVDCMFGRDESQAFVTVSTSAEARLLVTQLATLAGQQLPGLKVGYAKSFGQKKHPELFNQRTGESLLPAHFVTPELIHLLADGAELDESTLNPSLLPLYRTRRQEFLNKIAHHIKPGGGRGGADHQQQSRSYPPLSQENGQQPPSSSGVIALGRN